MDLKLDRRSSGNGATTLVTLYAGKSSAKIIAGDMNVSDLIVPKNIGQSITLKNGNGSVVIMSLGKREDVIVDRFRQAGGCMASWIRDRLVTTACVDPGHVDLLNREGLWALCEGLLLGDFVFDRHKSEPLPRNHSSVTVISPSVTAADKKHLERLITLCRGTNFARSIAHEPPNEINPQRLVDYARDLATATGLKLTVIDEKRMAKEKMGGILAVGMGSASQPRLIILEYAGKSAKNPVAVIGKAITFDTGGYSLKTTDGIVGMKYDKCGGAAVLGIMQAVTELKPKCGVVGIIAAAENMIAPHSYRPDDIVKTYSGKTVEIVSTDAEGRMVLADALTLAQKDYQPRAIIDMATLTGGMTVALGKIAAGLFCDHDALREALLDSSRRTHERLWPMPLWDDYNDLIKGDDADIKNSGGRFASPVVGGVFLKNFVDKKVPWAHIDIAGTATVDENKPYCPKGATGFGVRLVCDYLMRL